MVSILYLFVALLGFYSQKIAFALITLIDEPLYYGNQNQVKINSPHLKEINIFIVPHSHTDPGWLETLENYYSTQVRDILYNVLNELKADSKKKFSWAEICFLKMFYEELSLKD